MRDAVVVAIVDGALVVPRREDGPNRCAQLCHRVLGELAASVAAHDLAVFRDHLFQGCGFQVGGGLGPSPPLDGVECLLEECPVDTEPDVAEELDEPPIRVESEPAVVGELRQTLERCRVESEVEDRVHHPGHRELGSAAHADQKWIARIAESLARLLLDVSQRRDDLLPHASGKPLAAGVVRVARLGGDGEPGWDREPCTRHLRDARALATEKVAHRRVALFKAVHPFVRRRPPGSSVGAHRLGPCRCLCLLSLTGGRTLGTDGHRVRVTPPRRASIRVTPERPTPYDGRGMAGGERVKILVLCDPARAGCVEALAADLRGAGAFEVEQSSDADRLLDLTGVGAVYADWSAAITAHHAESLHDFAQGGGGVIAAGATLASWSEHQSVVDLAGWSPDGRTVSCELVVGSPDSGDATFRIRDRVHLLPDAPPDAAPLLLAPWRYTSQVVAYSRPAGAGQFVYVGLAHDPEVYGEQSFRRVVLRAVHRVAGTGNERATVGVGLLGFGALGLAHAAAIAAVSGLELR